MGSARPGSTFQAAGRGLRKEKAARAHRHKHGRTDAEAGGGGEVTVAPASSATVAVPFCSEADLPVHQVGGADEAVDEQGARLVVDCDRRAELLDLALVHDGDPVGDAHRLVLVMRHEDGREAQGPLQALDLDLHVETKVAIERGERFVEQQDRGLDGQRAGQCHPLLLTARELARQALLEAAELDGLEKPETLSWTRVL